MKKITSLLLGLVVLALFSCKQQNSEKNNNQSPIMNDSTTMKNDSTMMQNDSTTTSNNHKMMENDKMYSCPMHPRVHGNKNDKCPKCGMALELTNPKSSEEKK